MLFLRTAFLRSAGVVVALGSAAASAPGADTPGAKVAPEPKAYANPATIGTLAPGLGVPVGEHAPDAELRDSAGAAVRLGDLVRQGPLALVFYRGGWCPFCNFQIRELTGAYPEFRRRGVRPVAVSVDRVEEAAKTQAAYQVPFPVLSDPDLAAHRAFRVLHQVSEAEAERLRGFHIDLDQASGRTHHVIAVPAIFVIDAQGIVRWAHADPDYKVRPSAAQVLAAIDALGLPAAPASAPPPPQGE